MRASDKKQGRKIYSRLKKIELFLNRFYSKQRYVVIISGIILIIMIGILDYLTGYRIGFSIFYLIPLFIATLYVRKYAGIILSLFSSAAWLIADLITGHTATNPTFAYWDILIRLGFFLLIAFSILSLKRSLQEEKRLSKIDFLTGVANPKAFDEFINKLHNGPISIAYIDCDDFKKINDTRGHQQGDMFLKLISKIIKKHIRKKDFVARLGGDEFAVIFLKTEQVEVKSIMNRVNQALLYGVKDAGYPITFSIGVVTYIHMPVIVQNMIKKADDLMYAAKSSGKNTIKYHLFD